MSLLVSNVVIPRVHLQILPKFIGKTIRFIGQVSSYESEKYTLTLHTNSDPSYLNVCLTDSNLCVAPNDYVEVFAKVISPTQLSQSGGIINLGKHLDMDLVNEAIKLSWHSRFREYFQPLCDSIEQ